MTNRAFSAGDSEAEKPASVDTLMAQVEAVFREQVEEFGKTLGFKFYRMANSFKVAARYAKHRDPYLRDAALFLMNLCWGANPRTDLTYARAVLADPEPIIRRRALGWLALRNSGSLDPDVSTVLAWAVMDCKNPGELRCLAYGGFCMVRDIKVPDAVREAIETGKAELPPDVDLTLVKVFAAT